MLPPSSKRKWWERGRVHTYPTFDNKLNCAIELYYTHRDDGNLAAPEHRFSEWRHPMGPLEHWPSELVEALLREKRVTPTMLMHGDPRFPDTGCWIAMREGTEILRVSSKTVYDSGFSVDTDTVQLQLSKAKHAHAEALAKREQSAKAKIEQLQVDQQEHLRPWAEGLARAAAAAVADAAAADALEYSGENTNDEVRTPNYMEMLCRREAPAPGWMARLTERNRRSNHRMRLWDKDLYPRVPRRRYWKEEDSGAPPEIGGTRPRTSRSRDGAVAGFCQRLVAVRSSPPFGGICSRV
jgi:hypothetical protein